ncbi:hypothetical protein GOP47_0001008 [Adiantum capillus-veneris]|uniref:Peptidase A1 domain-containing protein n=1 Tax=Adiantum capillus-veneris TaxID=13818 RepID=A0A9D4VEC6_ADICA|nr:hypothetical protein GOP47_0001008 [Adiantum capillus-veneris]
MFLLSTHFLLTQCLACLVGCFLTCSPFIVAHNTPVLPPLSALHSSGSLTFPVYHKSIDTPRHIGRDHAFQKQNRSHRRRTLAKFSTDALNPPGPALSNGNVPALLGKVVTLSTDFGEFFAELRIGSPAMPLAVIIDSGSQLMWIQCMPCNKCGSQAISGYPIFEPAKSSSYTNVTCDTTSECPHTDDSIEIKCSTDSGVCMYDVSYADNSSSAGMLASDTLTLTTSNEGASSSFEFNNFVFGCGVNNAGIQTMFNASGLMGLGKGPHSIISQLSIDVFSYCLPNRLNNVDVTGYLTFGRGADANISLSSSMQYTSIVQLNHHHASFLPHDEFYYLGLTGISIDGKPLLIPPAALELNQDTGTGGTIIDSGTALTNFVDEAYTVIINAFNDYIHESTLMTITNVMLDNGYSTLSCYAVPFSNPREAPTVPTMTLHFEGSVAMELRTEHLLHLIHNDTTHDYYCLTMTNNGPLESGAKNIIGNFQQQNFLIEYDIANSRVGFAPTQCSASSPHTTTIIGKPILCHLTLIVVCILLSL